MRHSNSPSYVQTLVGPVLSLAIVVAAAFGTDAQAVTLEQRANPHDRGFERLPDIRVLRGAKFKRVVLEVGAEADEEWTLSTDQTWVELSATSGTGPGEVTMTLDHEALEAIDAGSAAVAVTGTVAPTLAILDVNVDVWPKLTDASTPAELRAFVKDPANWPSDSSWRSAWELWGFLPDDTTHPGEGAGLNMDAWETTPCPEGTDADDCVSDGQAGLAAGQSADQAFLLSTGDPRVVIAVLDSGIRWDDRDLVTEHYLNARELVVCPPPGADTSATNLVEAFDVNGDGKFNIRDYDDAEWAEDLNENGVRDPQDLIWGEGPNGPCSDGIDDDGNGYTDDISGWDFFWNDNDPSDDTSYGHGTGEAKDSGGEGNNEISSIGICAQCQILNVRVGDSFVVDVNQFADGTIFAVESGAKVVQEALGSINNTPYAQAAIDYAYDNNVAIIASAADERAYHHNYPGSLERTFYVHAIVADTNGDFADAATFLNFGNCTNWGGKLMLSTPGTGCSSEATGKTSGQAGLVAAYFLQLRDAARASGVDEDYYEPDLTTEELYQILVASADDIDVPGMETDAQALEAQRYKSNEDWDLQFGYGRNNSRRSLEVMRDKMIPAAGRLDSPRWYEVVDPERRPTLPIFGSVTSPRLSNLTWTLTVSAGVEGREPVELASGTGPVENEELAVIDFSSPDVASIVERSKASAGDDPEKFSVTLELRTTGEGPAGVVNGRFRKVFAVRTDADVAPGFPLYLDASGESSPKVSDLDGDGVDEIVVATADGRIHAIDANGNELNGFPTEVNIYPAFSDELCDAGSPKCHRNARAFTSGAVDASLVRSSITAGVAIADLNGDGSPCRDVVVATMDGGLFAFDCNGALLEGFPVSMDPANTAEFEGALNCVVDGQERIGCRTGQRFAEFGFFATPVLVDLDQDGDFEIVAAALDQYIYAWHHDGAEVNGWPVKAVNETFFPFDQEGDIFRYDGRIIATPAVADLFGDGTPIILSGSNERIENSTQSFLYAIWPDGNAHAGGAFPEGWPTTLIGFIPDEILPYVGRGNPNSPIAADVDNDGKDDPIGASIGGAVVVFDENGRDKFIMESTEQYYGPESDVDEPVGSLPVINNPSIADIDNNGQLDIINGTAGLGLIQVASSGGRRAEFDHSVSAWASNNGAFLDGFPHRVWDYQFFMNYAVADLDGDGLPEVISGDGGYHVFAPNAVGTEAPGFPKFTSQWHAATPAVGDVDNNGKIDVVANTREGWLWMWNTTGDIYAADPDAPPVRWAGFHHDDQNTGNIKTPLREYPKPLEPDDEDVADSCGCDQTTSDGPLGALAALLFAATLLGRRRSRRRV